MQPDIATKRALVFLDIDGTLLTPSYEPNSSTLPALISKLQEQYIFGLNSNRAIEDMLPIAEQFHIHGPLIVENGTAISWQKHTIPVPPNPSPIAEVVARALRQLASKHHATVLQEDTVHFTPSSSGLLWVQNAFRIYTASIHVYKDGKKDVEGARTLAAYLVELLDDTLQIAVSEIFANVLVMPKTHSKGKALAWLKQTYTKDMLLLMVGDDAADQSTLAVVDAFFAVGNADEALKQHARYTANALYTQGVEEILHYIQENYGITDA